MARGGKPLPPELKLIRGTLKKGREEKSKAGAPVPATEEILPSSPLNERETAIFADIVEDMRSANTASPTYRRVISHLARLEARAEIMRAKIGRRFVIRVKSTQGERVIKGNPALAQLSELESQIVRLYGALGLSPDTIARAPRTGSANPVEKNPFDEFRD